MTAPRLRSPCTPACSTATSYTTIYRTSRLRRFQAEGQPPEIPISCHTFRATGITSYLENGGTIEKAQQIAAHESPKTTKLYDRTGDTITLDEIERIGI